MKYVFEKIIAFVIACGVWTFVIGLCGLFGYDIIRGIYYTTSLAVGRIDSFINWLF